MSSFFLKRTFQRGLTKLIQTIGMGYYAGSIAGIPLFASTFGELKNHAALALPGLGIFIHPDDVRNIPLLRHEYGHVLQAKKWGKFYFYKTIAWISLSSARKANQNPKFIHQHTWTEWTANKLAYDFFRRPANWDMKAYPIEPHTPEKLPVVL